MNVYNKNMKITDSKISDEIIRKFPKSLSPKSRSPKKRGINFPVPPGTKNKYLPYLGGNLLTVKRLDFN
jgi:hypothetical protein